MTLITVFLAARITLGYGLLPGYQSFFLACLGELCFVGHRPTRVRKKAENASDEAARVTF